MLERVVEPQLALCERLMLWSDAKWRIERESVFPITCTRQIEDALPDENASLPLYKFSGQEDFEMGFN
jgi:hypothetical protein